MAASAGSGVKLIAIASSLVFLSLAARAAVDNTSSAQASDTSLPAGRVLISWWANRYWPQHCMYYDAATQQFLDDTMILWGSSIVNDWPPEADIEKAGTRLCGDNTTDAVLALEEALDAGGAVARTAAAVPFFSSHCPALTTFKSAVQALGQHTNNTEVLRRVQALVTAYEGLGLGVCFTLVVKDSTTGQVLATRQVHSAEAGTGIPLSCWEGVRDAVEQCDTVPEDCCGALDGLNYTCLGQLAEYIRSYNNSKYTEHLQQVLQSCQLSYPAPLPANTTFRSKYVVDNDWPVQCYILEPGAGNWTQDATQTLWGPSGSHQPPRASVESMISQLCGDNATRAAQAFLGALDGGYDTAAAALQAVMEGAIHPSPPRCRSRVTAALVAFLDSKEFHNTSNTLRYAAAFADAADAIGMPACMTIAITNLGSQQPLSSSAYKFHTRGRGNTSAVTSSCADDLYRTVDTCANQGTSDIISSASPCCALIHGLPDDCTDQMRAYLAPFAANTPPLHTSLATASENCKVQLTDTPIPVATPAPETANETAPAGTTEASHSSSAPIGAIVGGVVGGLAVLCLLVGSVHWLRVRRKRKSASVQPLEVSKLVPRQPALGSVDVLPPPTGSLSGTESLSHDLTASYITTLGGAGGVAYAGQLAPSSPSRGDPLLAWVSSQLLTQGSGGSAPAGSRPSSSTPPPSSPRSGGQPPAGPSGASEHLAAAMELWQVQWRDVKIDRLLGRGSFGNVYLGTWRETLVAVKILVQPGYVAEAEQGLELPPVIMHNLQKEAGVMFRMRHPCLVSLIGLCHLPPCLLTEYCEKGSLYELLYNARRDPRHAAQLTWRRRLGMLLDAAVGMLYLHGMVPPIIHCDLKSPNILVDGAWRAKVADFNLSRLLTQNVQEGDSALVLTGSQAAVGSLRAATAGGATLTSIVSTVGGGGLQNPLWLAPEVLAGHGVSTASDCFSFGTVMWEVLTWRLPWAGVSPFAVAQTVIQGGRLEVPARLALPGPDTPSFVGLDGYCELMRECWTADPAQRPPFTAIVPRLRALMASAPGE